jgi:hypothetical protein
MPWIVDMNYWIRPADDMGNPRHWSQVLPTPPDGGDYEDDLARLPNVNQQYRACLSDNTLINLFRDYSNHTNKLTFYNYYRGWSLDAVISFYIDRMPSILVDSMDNREKRAFHPSRVQSATMHLKRARSTAIEAATANPTLPVLRMENLYLDTYYQHTQRPYLSSIRASLQAFQDSLRWICLPFLQFSDTPDSRNPRPISGDLDRHLAGITTGPANDREIPFRDLDFYDLVFHDKSTTDLNRAYMNGRNFATAKGFLHREQVHERYRRERRALLRLDLDESYLLPADVDTNSGGNNKTCGCVGSTRDCVYTPDATSYCANPSSCPPC